MKSILILGLICYAVMASQYVPILKREPGILIGNPAGEVKIQLIYDPACEDSAEFDQVVQKVITSLNPQIRERISFRFISFALPMHVAAQKLTQAIYYVMQHKGNQQALNLFRDFLSNIEKYDEDFIRGQTIRGLLTRIAQRVNTLFGFKTEDVFKELQHYSATDNKVRQWSKYAMGIVRSAGAPRLRINGVTVEGAPSMTVEQLTGLIQSLFINSEEVLMN